MARLIRPAVPFPVALTPGTSDVNDAFHKAGWARWGLAAAAAISTFTAVAVAGAHGPVSWALGVAAVAGWAGFWYMGRVTDALWRAYGQVIAAQAELHAATAELGRKRG